MIPESFAERGSRGGDRSLGGFDFLCGMFLSTVMRAQYEGSARYPNDHRTQTYGALLILNWVSSKLLHSKVGPASMPKRTGMRSEDLLSFGELLWFIVGVAAWVTEAGVVGKMKAMIDGVAVG